MKPVSAVWKSLMLAGLTMTAQDGVFPAFPVVYVALLEVFPWGAAVRPGPPRWPR